MTVNEIIAAADQKEPNSVSQAEKLRWLCALDGRIAREVLMTHEGFDDTDDTYAYTDGTETLLIPSPYGEEIYTRYLIAMIAADNAETARYNQQIAMYNAAYREWWSRLNATHTPLHGGGRFLF